MVAAAAARLLQQVSTVLPGLSKVRPYMLAIHTLTSACSLGLRQAQSYLSRGPLGWPWMRCLHLGTLLTPACVLLLVMQIAVAGLCVAMHKEQRMSRICLPASCITNRDKANSQAGSKARPRLG